MSAESSYSSKDAKRCLSLLLVVFILGILCLQAFNLVFQKIGSDIGATSQASLITAIPGIVLGIVCFVYASLSDFVSLKRMTAIGFITLFVGSILGFFVHSSLVAVVLARSLQTAGAQVAGSVFLVVAARYLEPKDKVVFFGLFTAGYQLSTAIGVLAGGFLSTIDWSFLFLIPSVSILLLPIILKSLPDNDTSAGKVDLVGFAIFGVAVALLTLFFSFYNWMMLAAAVILFAVFGVYINKAEDPFITPDFFANKSWLAAVLLIFMFYFPNYAISPIVNGIGANLYGLTTAQVSLYLLWGNLAGAAFGIMSGKIMGKIGRGASLILAGLFLIVGLVSSAMFTNTSMAAIVVPLMFVYAGQGLIYSPIVDNALSRLSADQSGRGIGMNDLIMNTSQSIGIAVFGGLIGTSFASGSSLFAGSGAAANYSNLFLIFAGIEIVSLLVYLALRKMFTENTAEATQTEATQTEDSNEDAKGQNNAVAHA